MLAAGAIAGVTATSPTADAAPPIGHDRDREHDRRNVRFKVRVRHRGHWDTYRDRDDAQRVVRMLERQGRDARIEVERGRW